MAKTKGKKVMIDGEEKEMKIKEGKVKMSGKVDEKKERLRENEKDLKKMQDSQKK